MNFVGTSKCLTLLTLILALLSALSLVKFTFLSLFGPPCIVSPVG